LIIAMVAKWDYDHPVTLDGIGELPGCDYDELRRVVATFVTQLLPSAAPNPDHQSPTSGSERSATASEPTPNHPSS
jgi:hypothetical protein